MPVSVRFLRALFRLGSLNVVKAAIKRILRQRKEIQFFILNEFSKMALHVKRELQ